MTECICRRDDCPNCLPKLAKFELGGQAGPWVMPAVARSDEAILEGMKVIQSHKEKDRPSEPSGDQCTDHAEVKPGYYACFYPQMGGSGSRAVVRPDPYGGCFEAWIWHDGVFPFSDEEGLVAHLHHCSGEQFIEFGNLIDELEKRSRKSIEEGSNG